MRFLLVTLLAAIATQDALAAVCGNSEYFEYKFTPKRVGPVNPKDNDNAHGRCGTAEKHCEVVVQVYGDDKCKTGRNGVQMKGPGDKNLVHGRDMKPTHVGYKTHSVDNLSNARKLPFKVQVCDEDSFLRGGNDQILKYEMQEIREGCKDYKFQEKSSNKHPWFVEFELCCRPINRGGGRSSTFSDRSRGSSHGTGSRRDRTRHSPRFDDLRDRFEGSSGRHNNRYSLRSRPTTPASSGWGW